MTQEGYDKLTAELKNLEEVEKPKIAAILKEAIAQGDLSENFAYHDGKERQRKLEEKIIALKAEIRNADIEQNTKAGFVQLGSTIQVKSSDGKKKTYTITGREETDPSQGKISYDSPLGKAFIDRSAKDKVEIELPSGTKKYTILSIK